MSARIKNELKILTELPSDSYEVTFSPNHSDPNNLPGFNELYIQNTRANSNHFLIELEDLPHVVNYIKTFYNERVPQDKKIY